MISRELLIMKSISTGYGAKVVSSGLTATLGSGQLTCLIGTNGAGKSTLLRTLCGFQQVLKGEISILGKHVSDYSKTELAGIISVVLTDHPMLNGLTVRDVISMGRIPHTGFWGNLSSEDKQIVEESISIVRLNHLADRDASTLSDGERQKMMIAKAFAQRTPIIILDEPTSFLDFPSKIDIMLTLQDFARKHDTSILISTHDVELALHYADHLWMLSPDQFIIGSPRELSAAGEIEQFFNLGTIGYNREQMRFLF